MRSKTRSSTLTKGCHKVVDVLLIERCSGVVGDPYSMWLAVVTWLILNKPDGNQEARAVWA